MRKKYNKEFKDKIVNEFKNGKPKSVICKEYDISINTITHWINNENTIFVGNKKYDDNIVDTVLNDYINGNTVKQLSQKYSIRTGTIYSWIKKNNISRQKGPKSLCKNYTYFDNIDSELKAYFLGYIIADGNVSIINNQYAFKITLQYEDRYIIEKLKEQLCSLNRIRDFEQKSPTSDNVYKYSYLSIGNKHLVQSLIKLKVIPSKTFNEIIPEIDVNLLPHLIRGFFDGDGIAYKTDKGYSFGFVGNKNILNQIKNILGWENKLSPHFITKGIFTVLTSDKEKLLKFYHYMYDNSTFYLKRKHDKLLSIFET